MARRILALFFLFSLTSIFTTKIYAQEETPIPGVDTISTESSKIATASSQLELKQSDLTKPEEERAKHEFITLFKKRPISDPDFINFIGYTVQYAVRSGVPVNTIILILLLPALATIVVFTRQIIGLPTLEMLVPIALSVTLVATGLPVGIILLATILLGSLVSRLILKRIRIMQLPKMALSMLIISVFVFLALVVSASFRFFRVDQLSFLPLILLILLSDKIVGLQLTHGGRTAIVITFFTILIGALGYIVLSFGPLRNFVILYPEVILILIPINILLGRYFGLRLTEYHRFAAFRRYVNQ